MCEVKKYSIEMVFVLVLIGFANAAGLSSEMNTGYKPVLGYDLLLHTDLECVQRLNFNCLCCGAALAPGVSAVCAANGSGAPNAQHCGAENGALQAT